MRHLRKKFQEVIKKINKKNSFCPTFIRLSVPSWHGDLSQKEVKKKKKEEELRF